MFFQRLVELWDKMSEKVVKGFQFLGGGKEEEPPEKKYEVLRDAFYTEKGIKQATDMSSKEITCVCLLETHIHSIRKGMNLKSTDELPEESFIRDFQERRVCKDRLGRKEWNEVLKREVEVEREEGIAEAAVEGERKKHRWI